MVRTLSLTIAYAIIFGLLTSWVCATQCPYCIGVDACARNIPTVDCTTEIVNETVSYLSKLISNPEKYTVPDTPHACVNVSFRNVVERYKVQGCVSASGNFCGDFKNGSEYRLICWGPGKSTNALGQRLQPGALLVMVLFSIAFALIT